MTISPSRKTKTIELRTETTHRRLASMVRAAFLAIDRTMRARAMRTVKSNSSDFRLSSTMELSTCGSHVVMDGSGTIPLIEVQGIPRAGHTLLSFPSIEDFLLVEGQCIAKAIQGRLGTILRRFADE